LTDYTLEFGWPDDGGLGERLVQQILDGHKTATCCPRSDYDEEELAEVVESVGEVVDVLDGESGEVRCRVRMLAVYETTFGLPAPGLIAGEGNGTNVNAFKQDHMDAWAEDMAAEGRPLTDDTILVVEEFELIEE